MYGSVDRPNGRHPALKNVVQDHDDDDDFSRSSSEWIPLVVPENDVDKEKEECTPPGKEPEPDRLGSGVSIFSRLVFHWFTPILHRGNEKKRLDQEDLGLIPLPLDCQTKEIQNIFDHFWDEQAKEPSLIRSLFAAFGADYLRAGVLKLVHDLCVFVGPQVLHAVIVFLRTPNAPLWQGLLLTLGVTLSQIAMSLCLRHYFFKCYTTGLRVRSAIVLSVYRKALRLSASERQTKSLGEITNLMSIDAQRLQDLMNYLHALWYSPLQIGLALYFLWQQLGVSSLGGVAVIIIMIPVTKYTADWMANMQQKLMEAKDRRVEVNSEVLSGMKVIKLQAWEEPFSLRILQLRNLELSELFRYFLGTAVADMLWTFTPLGVALATFATYVLLGNELDVASALTALALFEILRFPLFMLPSMINGTVQAYVSLERIQRFLLSENYEIALIQRINDGTSGVQMKNVSAAYDTDKMKLASALTSDKENVKAAVEKDPKLKKMLDKKWEIALLQAQLCEAERRIREMSSSTTTPLETLNETGTSSLLCLKHIDFQCLPGDLVGVVGGVGCGKSSLVNAIFGEVRQLTGATAVQGTLAYFSQTPFIMNATVRENILFGHVDDEKIDEERYQRSLDCCALRHDLKLLPDGDSTEIGEKGITLSGGQKARVALARAVYHQADITVIDDALAAVDSHVAVQLFQQAIVQELLRPKSPGSQERSVILITNAIQHLKHKRVKRIYVMQEGRMIEQGSYLELSSQKDSLFSRFLAAINETGISTEARALSDAATKVSGMLKQYNNAESLDPSSETKRLPQKLMIEEARQSGHVSSAVYLAWCKAAGGASVPLAVLVIFTVAEGLSVLSNWWLTYWSAHGSESQYRFLAIYAVINVCAIAIGLVRTIFLAFIGLIAARAVRIFVSLCVRFYLSLLIC